jgi:arsenite methyltransferase
MTIDRSFSWQDVHCVTGSCMRPGGPLLTRKALEFCTLAEGAQVADIGCGAGETLELLEGAAIYRPVGLDHSTALLEKAVPRLGSSRIIRGRAETLPFKDALFDALFCECVLSILEDGAKALQEYARVLREGGFLILSDVFAKHAPARGRPEPDLRRFRAKAPLVKEDLLGFLEGLGFSLLLWEEHERLLREFAARMILAGIRLPDSRSCAQGWKVKKPGYAGLSYFLLVGQKG